MSVDMCSRCSLHSTSPAVSLMPVGSADSSAEPWMLSLTPPDLLSFCPGLLEERNKNVQAFWRDYLFSSPFFKIATHCCTASKDKAVKSFCFPHPSSFPVAHTNTALPAFPVRNGRVGLLTGLGPLCLIVLKGPARECCLCLTYLWFFLLPLRMNRAGAVLPQNCMWS